MKIIFPKPNEDPLELLERCHGYYICPKAPDGTRLGPLVRYAGKYDDEHHWVGEEYINFAQAERHAPVLSEIARCILCTHAASANAYHLTHATGFCGAPEGGKALANTLAGLMNKQYIFPEKGSASRGAVGLDFKRHQPERGESWFIVEDVCNNFSTTKAMIRLINEFGGSVSGIICFLNRSPEFEDLYDGLPIISLVRKIIPEYRQDDLFVAADVRALNIACDPKNQWRFLVGATEKATQA